ncbi:MAG: glycosyltransferase family 2 protein [Bacteroidota bacterium]
MQNKPKISVIMPVYNCELYIQEAVESILAQTYTDFELLLIDDASKDKTVEIIKSFNDNRINLIQKPKNLGYTDSLNYGFSVAEGEYIARMDGDDFSLPTRFEKQVAYLDKHPDVVLCGANYSIIGTDIVNKLPENNDEIQIQFIRNNSIAHPVVMLRNSVLKANGIVYDVTKEPAEDFDLWVRLLNYGKLHNIQEVLLNYRVHQKQVSNLQSKKQRNISIDTKLNVFKNLSINWNQEEEKVLRKHLANIFFIDLKELETLKKINQEILQSNESKSVFNHKLLTDYLKKDEERQLLRYFIRNPQFNPQTLIEYYKNKKDIKPSLSFKDEMKLILKCLRFYKTK